MAKRLSNNFQFIDVGRVDPKKIPLEGRTHGFGEIYQPYEQTEVSSQAHRCLECGNPYC